MATSSQEVYHCPSCGALVPVRAGEAGERECGECGFEFRQPVRITPRSVSQPAVSSGGFVQRDVSARRRQGERVEPVVTLEAHSIASGPEDRHEPGEKEEVVSDDGHKKVVRRTRKRRRTRLAPLIFLCGWAVVVMLLVIVVRSQVQSSGAGADSSRAMEEQMQRAKERAIVSFIEENYESCRKTLDEFLETTTAAQRAQFVRDSGRLAPVMADYYKSTLPWTIPADGRVVTKAMNLFMRGEKRAIELLVGIEGGDPPVPDREVAFVRQGGRWVLEWESLVRYSTEPWQLFVKRIGNRKGVFRVYMRESPVALETAEPAMRVQFLPPRDDEVMWQQDSDWVVVGLESKNGRRIEAIMAEARRERELGDSIFGIKDPPGLYRVRVVLEWDESGDGEMVLALREVQAGNWYGPGFEEDLEAGSDPGAEVEGGESATEPAAEKAPSEGGER